MSVKTIYKCDKCGTEQDNDTQFWTVGVTANHGLKPNTCFVTGKSMQVCRPCLEGFGLFVQKRPDIPTPSKEPSIEEMIREIIEMCIDQ